MLQDTQLLQATDRKSWRSNEWRHR